MYSSPWLFAIKRACAQYPDPRIWTPWVMSLVITGAMVLAVVVGEQWLLSYLHSSLAALGAGAVSDAQLKTLGESMGMGSPSSSGWVSDAYGWTTDFMLPIMLLVVSCWTNTLTRAAESWFYPDLSPGRRVGIGGSLGIGLSMGGKVVFWTALSMLVGWFIPFLGEIFEVVVSCYTVFHGVLLTMALRRMTGPQAIYVASQHQREVWIITGVLSAVGLIPGLNLLVPLVGILAMVHVLHIPVAALPAEFTRPATPPVAQDPAL